MPSSLTTLATALPAPYAGPMRRGVLPDGAPALLRFAAADDPSGRAALTNARAIAADLPDAAALQPLATQTLDGRPTLAVADAGQQPLQLAAPVQGDLGAFLARAEALTVAVAAVHAAGVIHRALQPDTVWLAPEGHCWLSGFDEATRASAAGTVPPVDPAAAGGRLPYLAPEQTGRLNRVVDHRADLYGLGVLLFEQWSGRLPLEADDPSGWVHAHVARRPARLDAPRPLADMVDRLLAKAPEDRYQTAAGLLADIRRAREALSAGALSDFEPTGHAYSDRFQIPQALFGREAARAQLQQAFKAAAGGAPQLSLVGGPAGIGKSRLVAELKPWVVARQGFFCAGKARRYERDRPYAVLADALAQLVEQALTRPQADLDAWAAALAQALGPNGRVVEGLIPAARHLLGPTDPVPDLEPEAARLRLAQALSALLEVLARPAHPLVLALDDLQWADGATLALMEQLLQADAGLALHVVGAFRDDELGPDHGLPALQARLQGRGHAVDTLALGPLPADAVQALVAAAVGESPEQVAPLAELVGQKTGANPFFVGRFLQTLHEEGLLSRDPAAHRWTWDLDAIAQAAITDNVVELMAGRIRRLPDVSRALLVQAAVVGSVVAVDALAEVRGLPADMVTRGLAPAVRQGLLVPLGEAALRPEAAGAGSRFRFVHDRVQEAARSLLPEPERTALHLALAQRLTPRLAEGDDALLFDVADHLAKGAAALPGVAERHAAAGTLAQAAGRARAAGAHELARTHFQAAADLLTEGGWAAEYPLTLQVHLGLADALRLAGDVAGAQAMADAVDAQAKTALDRVGVHGLRAQMLINELQVTDAAKSVLATAADLGHPVPVPTSLADLQARVGATMGRVVALGPAGVQGLEDAHDPQVIAASHVLGSGLPALAMGLREMHPTAALLAVDLTLSHGVAPGSATAFSHLGIMLCAAGQYDAGWMVGQISEALRRRSVPQGLTGGLVEFLAFIHHWKQPFPQTADALAAGARRALELGDPQTYGYCANTRYMVRLLAGEALPVLDADFGPTVAGLMRYGQGLAAMSASIWGQAVDLLVQGGDQPTHLVGERFDAPAMRPQLAQAPPVIAAYIACAQALLGLVFDQPETALAALEATADTLADPAVAPAVVFPGAVTYRAVSVAAAAAQAQGERRAALEAQLTADLALLAGFAATAPTNHMHRLQWAQAEQAALAGDVGAAMDAFGRAAHAAQTHGFVQDEALIHQRAGAFHLRAGRVVPARGHLREAARALAEWGATAAADALWRRHADVLGPQDGGQAGPTLDVGAVLAASEALGAADDLEGLLQTLMGIVIQNAAAERGVLVLDRQGELLVAAEASPQGSEVLQATALEAFEALPLDIVHFVARTAETVVCDDARVGRFATSADVRDRDVKSVLCVPLVHRGARLGVVYLENTLAAGVFTEARARMVQALAGQGATALQNAILLKEAREGAERLAAQNQQLTKVDRLRDEFLAKTSHELRTPLNGIIGLARSLLDGAHGALPEAVDQNLDMIVSSGRRLASLINDILDFSALREDALTVRLAPTEAAGVLDRVLGILRPLLDAKGLTVRDRLPAELPLVMADEDRLEQVLLNLVGNAAKFTDVGGITLDAQASEGTVRFEITDTGPGIPADLHERVFQAFDQGDADVDTARGGTGLGLPIARQLVEAQGGRIGVRSVEGEGSTFWFELPVAQGVDHLAARTPRRPTGTALKPSTVVLEPVPQQPRPGDGARILVVDDEPVNLQVVLQHLQPQGFTVHTALGGRTALDRLEAGLEVDAIILDVMMPDLDGLAVTEAIRRTRHGAALPILLLTAKNQTGDLIDGLGAGANDYVTKPVDGPELIARLRTHLALSRFNRAADRFVPHAFVDALGRGSLTELRPGDAKAQHMTVLFADMHGFGELTRGWAPADSFKFVNRWLSVLEPPITAHGGFVDKYMGDTVMALFAGPFTDAVAAAVAMQRAITAFNADRRAQGRTPVRLGVGVHSGELVLGAVGNERRMDTTVISDAVNAASALEQRTKRLRAGVLVAGEAREALEAAGHRVRHVDQLHGDPVFEIYDADPAGAVAAKEATRPIFERAVQAFHARAFGEAERLFQVCRALDPADPAARDYAERCERVRQSIEGGA